MGSRKRPAPGASPIMQQHQAAPVKNIKNDSPMMSSDPYLLWQQQNLTNATTNYPDPTGNFSSNLYNDMSQPKPLSTTTSNQLTRRPVDQQLVSRTVYNSSGNDNWPIIPEDGLHQPQEQAWPINNDDLEQRAQTARRETQAKRKQIPPFVQKLSRYVIFFPFQILTN